MVDESDAIAAMGLECISLMCKADALDFYKAWPVVCHQFTDPPSERPLVAAKWVALLADGHLDAKAFPEKAQALMDLLWLAAKDPLPQVKTAKCTQHFSLIKILKRTRI